MDAITIQKRLDQIESRVSSLVTSSGFPMGFNFNRHVKSKYYSDALHGVHPFIQPAENDAEYLERRDYFQATKKNATEAFADITNRSQSHGQRWFTPFNIRIGIVADEFLYKSFVSTADFVVLTPSNFRDYQGNLDLVLVTSTWRGSDNVWVGAAQKSGYVRNLLDDELIPWFKDQGIPVAFYSKEDPPNYSAFLETARRCDFIFTSAIEMIPQYEVDCPDAKSISVLPFSIDHAHHHPIGSRRHRIDDVVFAGSWHNHKYKDRRDAAYDIFDGVIQSGRNLRIIDRNWDLERDRYMFPERYLPYLEPAIDHETLLNIQRTSDIAINLNSVIDSQTMYANRVIELQAMGCAVISNYSAGVNDQFPNVFMPSSSFDTASILNSLDAENIHRNQMSGLRNVYTHHVNFDRVREILEVCGIAEKSEPTRRIGIVGERVVAERFIERQSFEGALSVHESYEQAVANGLNLICDVYANFDYGQFYLQDLVNATKFVDCQVIFKADKNFPAALQLDYTNHEVPSHGALRWVDGPAKKTLTSGSSFVLDQLEVRPSATPEQVTDSGKSPVLSVVVPIYNNGMHLKYKCFESLRRSSIFDQMEILLVDDGSSDAKTIRIIKELESTYGNVRSFFHERGGSGSASRPRNVGLGLAEGEWVTYLDPDNEATGDGYAKLLKLVQSEKSDFAIGNMIRFAKRRTLVNNVRILRKQVIGNEVGLDTYEVTRELVSKVNYQPMSIQALVANTEWLRSLNLIQPVGAVGQDSYFFQQMLFYARKISLINEPIHTYFAAVSNSTVNSLGARFYQKYLPLEEARSSWLREVGLLDDYKTRRLEAFVKGWYIEKLKRVPEDELEECKQLIVRLTDFFGENDWKDQEVREFFKQQLVGSISKN